MPRWLRGLLSLQLLWMGAACAVPLERPEWQRTQLQGAGIASGCGLSPGTPLNNVLVQGRRRQVITALPRDYDAFQAHRLVLAFHGRTSPNNVVRQYYDLERHATGPTIFVYPAGEPTPGGGRNWWRAGESPAALRDYELFDTLLVELSRRYCIDRDQVFLVGHSLGASFVNSLACARGLQIAGFASLGGGVQGRACEGAVAGMVLHNPKDRLVPVSYGQKVRDLFLATNSLSGAPLPVEPRWLACLRWGEPDAAAPLLWCPHRKDHSWRGKYYPHNWPRGTGAEIMRFFDSLQKFR